MYGLPSVYQYFFTEFIPSLMRDTRGFNYDRMLIDVQKLLNKIVKQLGDSSLNFEEIYSTEQGHSSSIINLTSDLFRTVFTEKQQIVGEGNMMSALIDNHYRTSKTINLTSASYCLYGLHALKMEGKWIKCVHHITSFLQKFMPVFFVKVNRLENIMNFFRTIFKMKYLAVRKIELSTFCGINLSFLQFWEILELRSLTSKDRYILELMSQLRKAYFRFCANHFSWTIFTRDCYKEYNHIDSMETVIQNLRYLYYIHAKIVTFKDDYGSARLIGDEATSIYNRTFNISSKFDFTGNVIVKREESSFTLKKLTGLLAYNSAQNNHKSVYLNLIPEDFYDPNSGGAKAHKYSSRKLQRIIGDMVADEIEKLKGFFYTKFKHNSRYPDLLGYDKIKEASFTDDIKTLFWENPQAALAYSLRLQSQVQDASPNMLAKVFGPLVEQCLEVFIRYKDFLTHFVDYKAEQHNTSPMEGVDAIMYWEMPYIPLVLKYIGQEYDRHEVLGNFFAKAMQRINSNQLSFYLSQIFQSLDYKTGDIIEDFMVSYAEKSPLFAHQVIWMARVEQKADSEKETKLNKMKRERASRLPLRIIKNMGLEEKKFWDEVDSFFEQITKISSILKPKMEKSEKKSIINSQLLEIKMPPLVYMPTNPEYIVTNIKQGSGNPMQSAAKCPILVSFHCKKFEGPDKYFANLKAKKQSQELQRSPTRMMDDFDENVEPLAEKLNRSISVKGAFINREIVAEPKLTESPELGKEKSTKLNAFTEELFPMNWEAPAEERSVGVETNKQPPKKGSFNLKGADLGYVASPANKSAFSAFRTSDPKFSWQGSSFGASAKKYLERSESKPAVPESGQNQVIKLGEGPASGGRLSKEITAARTLQAQSSKDFFKQETLLGTQTQPNVEEEQVVSCIFKTFDDIRRDNLSLQVIQIFQEIFNMEKLDLFLFPYKTISTRTGNEQTIGGIIEVVPNTMSRDQIGKENKYSLYDFFREKYGSELSTMYQQARENFVKSMAAYSIVSYILQIKDRHNGNILIDQQGHLIHIDFGFIFSISPGKNLGFENAAFKLTAEMIEIMGGNTKAEPYRMFVDNTIRAFLAVRKYKELIINIVELITKSTLGCFNEESMVRLRARFLEDMNDNQAAKHVKKMINHAYKNYRTYLYDKIQWLQNKIES